MANGPTRAEQMRETLLDAEPLLRDIWLAAEIDGSEARHDSQYDRLDHRMGQLVWLSAGLLVTVLASLVTYFITSGGV